MRPIHQLNRVVVVRTILGMFLLALALAPCAQAGIIRDGKLVFDPYTKNHDPLNLLFMGGRAISDQECTNLNQSGRKYISPACVAFLHRLTWRQGPGSFGGRMDSRICNGKDTAYFYSEAGTRIAQLNPRSVSTSASCRRQWHVRLWDDEDVHNDLHDAGEWTLGMIYRETRCAVPHPGSNCYGSGSHKPLGDWEDAEDTEVYQMGKSTNGEPALCTYPDWRVIPGQRPAKNRGRYSDGKMSRISAQRIDPNAPQGHKCEGA